MKVRVLIAMLEAFDPDMEVCHRDHDGWYYDPVNVVVGFLHEGRLAEKEDGEETVLISTKYTA